MTDTPDTKRGETVRTAPEGDRQSRFRTGSKTAPASRNARTAMVVSAVAALMVGASFAAVPLYDAFCRVTGWGGTTQRAAAAPAQSLSRKITVQFDATVGRGLGWRFTPLEPSQTLLVGETGLVYYEAENITDTPLVGRATFNVSPAKAGLYFSKIECFCFTEQLLQPGESMEMPVTYFVDPMLADDVNMDDVHTITLSYTFFPWNDAPVKTAASSKGSAAAPGEDG